MGSPDALRERMAACTAAVEARLDAFLRGRRLPPRLDEPVRYALLGGGKRVRPCLAWLSCEAMGADPAASVPAGCAIELVHAFSLVHDDLPAIDNDDLRRGRPALHVHAGEAGAVLAGDAMLALAFLLLSEADEALGVELFRELTVASVHMIEGQVMDVAGSARDLETLKSMHGFKTGALITASCRMGGMCGSHASGAPAELESLTRYGEAIGLMFQIVDDLLDVEQASEAMGKPAGSDKAAGKVTYPDLIGVAGCRGEIKRLREEALEAVEGLEAEGLRLLVDELAGRTR